MQKLNMRYTAATILVICVLAGVLLLKHGNILVFEKNHEVSVTEAKPNQQEPVIPTSPNVTVPTETLSGEETSDREQERSKHLPQEDTWSDEPNYSLDYQEYYGDFAIGLDSSGYKHYELDTLLRLADEGDVLAMKNAIIKLIEKADQTNDPKQVINMMKTLSALQEKAVVYGDRELLDWGGDNFFEEWVFLSESASDDEKHQNLMNALAFYEFAEMRGAFPDKYYGQRRILKTYFPDKTEITPEEKAQIFTKAQEIYDSYEQKRFDAGLGPFDNSVPTEVAESFDVLRQEYRETMGDLAIE